MGSNINAEYMGKSKSFRKNRRKKRKNDPFYIEMPVNMSPLRRKRMFSSICNPNSSQKQIQSQTMNNSLLPISKQLQSLTRFSDNIRTPLSNQTMFSTLPHTTSHKKHKQSKTECIEETRTTNEDLQYFQTPERFHSFKTLKPKQSDKQEMDASDDGDDINENDASLSQPKWLKGLTNKTMETNTNNEMQNNQGTNFECNSHI